MRCHARVILVLCWLLPVVAASPAGGVSVTDDTGHRVQLERAAQRIITLSPHATELVYAAGAGDRLVAVAPYSDFPPRAATLPTIGGLGGLDRERLLALAPDLVIAWHSGNRPADLAWLDRQAVAVYRSEPGQLEDIARNLRDIGVLAGTAATADSAAHDYLRSLARACPGQPTAAGAFIRLAERPLLTVGHGHWMDRAIRRAGLHNIYADLPGRALTVSEESLMARRPAVTLYLAYPGATPPEAGQAIGLDPAYWARPGPRLPAGIARLCRQLRGEAQGFGLTSGTGK
jgi:iron complex transport system substrate-binding protein